jgi:hypothetical protein
MQRLKIQYENAGVGAESEGRARSCRGLILDLGIARFLDSAARSLVCFVSGAPFGILAVLFVFPYER